MLFSFMVISFHTVIQAFQKKISIQKSQTLKPGTIHHLVYFLYTLFGVEGEIMHRKSRW